MSSTSDRWLLVAAGTVAAAAWILLVSSPGLGATWKPTIIRVLQVASFAMLFTWFGVAALDHPRRIRVPILVGLGLSMLRLGLGFLAELATPLSGSESVLRTLATFLGAWWPDLVGFAALACYLVAFLGIPRREALRWWQPRALPVVVLVCLADLAVGLRWLAPVSPEPGTKPTLTLLGGGPGGRPGVCGRDRRRVAGGADRPPGWPGGAGGPRWGCWRGAVGGGVGNSMVVGLPRLAVLLAPMPLVRAIFAAPFQLALFAGTALVAFAAARIPAAWSEQGRDVSTVPPSRPISD